MVLLVQPHQELLVVRVPVTYSEQTTRHNIVLLSVCLSRTANKQHVTILSCCPYAWHVQRTNNTSQFSFVVRVTVTYSEQTTRHNIVLLSVCLSRTANKRHVTILSCCPCACHVQRTNNTSQFSFVVRVTVTYSEQSTHDHFFLLSVCLSRKANKQHVTILSCCPCACHVQRTNNTSQFSFVVRVTVTYSEQSTHDHFFLLSVCLSRKANKQHVTILSCCPCACHVQRTNNTSQFSFVVRVTVTYSEQTTRHNIVLLSVCLSRTENNRHVTILFYCPCACHVQRTNNTSQCCLIVRVPVTYRKQSTRHNFDFLSGCLTCTANKQHVTIVFCCPCACHVQRTNTSQLCFVVRMPVTYNERTTRHNFVLLSVSLSRTANKQHVTILSCCPCTCLIHRTNNTSLFMS